MIRQPLAERPLTDPLGFDVFGQRLVVGETLHHFLLELGEFAAFLPKQFGNIARAEAVEIVAADIALGRKFRIVGLDAVEQARAHHVELGDVAGGPLPALDDARKADRPHPFRPGRRGLHGGVAVARRAVCSIRGFRHERLFGHRRLLLFQIAPQADISRVAA